MIRVIDQIQRITEAEHSIEGPLIEPARVRREKILMQTLDAFMLGPSGMSQCLHILVDGEYLDTMSGQWQGDSSTSRTQIDDALRRLEGIQHGGDLCGGILGVVDLEITLRKHHRRHLPI